jgi:hypothetical protein
VKYYKAVLSHLAAAIKVTKGHEHEALWTNRLAYERELNWHLSKVGKHLRFNEQANSIVDVLQEGEMQSYSGTLLNQILFRSLPKKMYDQFKFMIVFESNNVLPAVIAMDGQGREHLWGIETTVSGLGFKNYGPVTELDKIKQPIRVIDAHYFAVIEALRSITKNGEDVVASALKATAAAHNFPLEAMEAKFQTASLPPADSSPFSFVMPDQANVFPSGDAERIAADNLNRDFSSADIWSPTKQSQVLKTLAVPVPPHKN